MVAAGMAGSKHRRFNWIDRTVSRFGWIAQSMRDRERLNSREKMTSKNGRQMSFHSHCAPGWMKDVAKWALRVGRTERAPCQRQAEKRTPATSDAQVRMSDIGAPEEGAPRSDLRLWWGYAPCVRARDCATAANLAAPSSSSAGSAAEMMAIASFFVIRTV